MLDKFNKKNYNNCKYFTIKVLNKINEYKD